MCCVFFGILLGFIEGNWWNGFDFSEITHFSPFFTENMSFVVFVPKKHLLQQIQGVWIFSCWVRWLVPPKVSPEVRPYWHRARNQIRPDRSGGGQESLSVTGESDWHAPLQNIGPIKLRGGTPPKKSLSKIRLVKFGNDFRWWFFWGWTLHRVDALAGGIHIFDFQTWQSKACSNGIFVVPGNDATKPILWVK